MASKEEQVFAVVKAKVLEVLIDVDPSTVTPDRRLTDLGANSIDRVEIAMLAMEALGISIPAHALHGVKDLRGLIDVLGSRWDGA